MTETVSYGYAENSRNQKNFPDGKALGTKIAHGQKQIKKCGCLVWKPERSDFQTEKHEYIQGEKRDRYHQPEKRSALQIFLHCGNIFPGDGPSVPVLPHIDEAEQEEAECGEGVFQCS